jgi:hypothetical protein
LNFRRPGTIDGLKFVYVGGLNNARALFEFYVPPKGKPQICQWADIEGGALAAIANYIFPLARATRTTPFGAMPHRGTLYARAVWNYAPASPHIDYAPLGNEKFVVDTLTLKIDIIEQKMAVQFPYADWLAKPNNAWFLHLLKLHEGFQRCAESIQVAVAYFELPLGRAGSILRCEASLRALWYGFGRSIRCVRR